MYFLHLPSGYILVIFKYYLASDEVHFFQKHVVSIILNITYIPQYANVSNFVKILQKYKMATTV